MLPILSPIIDIVGKVVDRVIPDPVQKAQLQIELAKLADQAASREHDEMMGQIGTNTEEAKSSNLFVAGWRPFVGWTGGVALAYSFVVCPFMSWTAQVIFHYAGTFPTLDTGQLMDLVMGMLGFGGLRTYEKIKGVPDSTPLVSASPPASTVNPTATLPKKKGLGSKVFGDAWPF